MNMASFSTTCAESLSGKLYKRCNRYLYNNDVLKFSFVEVYINDPPPDVKIIKCQNNMLSFSCVFFGDLHQKTLILRYVLDKKDNNS